MKDFIILKGAEVEGVPEIISVLPLGRKASLMSTRKAFAK